MLNINDGQCGLCKHFGEHQTKHSDLQQIRSSRKAPENYVEECGHPQHAPLHLSVTATSGCQGFERA